MATSSAGRTTLDRPAPSQRRHGASQGPRAGVEGDVEPEVLAKIAELDEPDRDAAPRLEPRLWYGMPAYGTDGNAAVFLQPAGTFKARYATLGFNDGALLDDGAMWATASAITTIDDEVEARIRELVVRAAG